MSSVKLELLEQIHCKIQQVEAAILRISRTKKQLKDNALMAKDGIHTTISRNLESLRNREVWLLGQVDLLEHAKEDILRQQQGELNQAVGGLKNALEVMDDPNLVNQLQDVLQRVEKLNLSPDETPCLTFRAESLSLREAIQEYGHVDTTSLPIQRAFVSHESSSTCLPRSFEEYEDADHHMMYKTVHSLQNDTVHVSIPKLAKDQWLHHPKPMTKLPVRPASIPSYLDKLSTDASIKNWLCQIKHEGDMEEDGFEMVPCMGSSSPGSEEAVPSMCPFNHFINIASSPLKMWLKQRNVSSTCPFDTMKYFQEVSNDYRDWLTNYDNKMLSSADNQDSLKHLTHIQESCARYFSNTDNSQWLSSISGQASMPPSSVPRFDPFHASTDTASWLLSEKPTTEDADWLISATPDSDTSSWLMSDNSESKPTHLFEYFKKVSSNPSDWLLSNRCSVRLESDVTDCLDNNCMREENVAPPVDQSSWILSSKPDEAKCPSTSTLSFKMFHQSLDDRKWLKSSSVPSSDNTEIQGTPHSSQEMLQQWVTGTSAPDFHHIISHSTQDDLIDRWLHPSRKLKCPLGDRKVIEMES